MVRKKQISSAKYGVTNSFLITSLKDVRMANANANVTCKVRNRRYTSEFVVRGKNEKKIYLNWNVIKQNFKLKFELVFSFFKWIHQKLGKIDLLIEFHVIYSLLDYKHEIRFKN